MERGIHLGLNLKQVHRVAQVGDEFRRYRRCGLEELREDLGETSGQRIGGVDEVEVDRSLVRVDDHLDGVPNVVET